MAAKNQLKAKAKRGRPMGAKGFTAAEDDLIRVAVQTGGSLVALAKVLGRGRSSVYLRVEKMTARGTIGPGVFDLGQIEGAAHDSQE